MSQLRLSLNACAALAAVILGAHSVWAQAEVGTVAGLVGTFEVRRGGAKQDWQPVFVGAPLLLKDDLRTAGDSVARIVLRDDTVIDLGAGTQIVVDRFAVDAAQPRQRALLRLTEGKVRVLLGGKDSASLGRFEVETPTAVIGGRTAAFIVRYDPSERHTDVVGVEGTTDVQGTLGMLESAAQVGGQQWTRVAKGQLPAPPEAINDDRFASYVNGLEITGTGNRETLDVGHPALAGRLLRPEDRPGAAPAAAAAKMTGAPGSFLSPAVPGETFAERRSKDLAAGQQPIPEFRFEDPDVPTQ